MKIYLGKLRNYFVDLQSFPVPKDGQDTIESNVSTLTDKYKCHMPENSEPLQCASLWVLLSGVAK